MTTKNQTNYKLKKYNIKPRFGEKIGIIVLLPLKYVKLYFLNEYKIKWRNFVIGKEFIRWNNLMFQFLFLESCFKIVEKFINHLQFFYCFLLLLFSFQNWKTKLWENERMIRLSLLIHLKRFYLQTYTNTYYKHTKNENKN